MGEMHSLTGFSMIGGRHQSLCWMDFVSMIYTLATDLTSLMQRDQYREFLELCKSFWKCWNLVFICFSIMSVLRYSSTLICSLASRFDHGPPFLCPRLKVPILLIKHLMLLTFDILGSKVTCRRLVWDCESTIAVPSSLPVTNEFSFLRSCLLKIRRSVVFEGICSEGELRELQLVNSTVSQLVERFLPSNLGVL